MLELQGLVKYYGARCVVDEVDFPEPMLAAGRLLLPMTHAIHDLGEMPSSGTKAPQP